MSLVIHPTYFPNILFFSKILNHNKILFEINDHYIKQSLRNRTSIYHANGILNLSVPVRFSSKKNQKFKDIVICNDTDWQKNHLKSIMIMLIAVKYQILIFLINHSRLKNTLRYLKQNMDLKKT